MRSPNNWKKKKPGYDDDDDDGDDDDDDDDDDVDDDDDDDDDDDGDDYSHPTPSTLPLYYHSDCLFTPQVSQVNEGNFLDTAHELQTSFKNFTNEKTYLNLLSRLKASICKKTSKLKNVQWDKIQNYCQVLRTRFSCFPWIFRKGFMIYVYDRDCMH